MTTSSHSPEKKGVEVAVETVEIFEILESHSSRDD